MRDAGPSLKLPPGTHNRRARRAAKAQKSEQRGLLPETETDAQKLRALWEAFGRHQRREQAKRDAYWASRTPDEIDVELGDRQLAVDADGWDPLFIGLLAHAVPLWAHRHWTTPPDARIARAHELGDVIAFSQGAAEIGEQSANHDSAPNRAVRASGEIGRAFNAVAEGLAIGAYAPDGARFGGFRWLVEGSDLRVMTRALCEVHPLASEEYWRGD